MNTVAESVREPFEFINDEEDHVIRHFFVPDTYTNGRPCRLTLDDDGQYDTIVALESVTSESKSAQVLAESEKQELILTREEVQWLHKQFGELIQKWNEK